ncbi:hypothetical protein TKK_0014187 [Trichogramma kaykai]|uniref:E3 ubiquitin-protein ligase RNF25 n=1 Tax=Trichogramma kaykai TaxID=54128 RepID=A0ABD2WEU8_9HYME
MSILDERLTDEIEALQAILLDDELRIVENDRGEPEVVEALVFPSTGEDSESQYVCVKLNVTLVPNYPDAKPIVSLRNPRGLDEDTVKKIQKDVDAKCEDFIGQPVIFELIELVREHLTTSNLPTGQCAVCLYGFRDGDKFTKTECYHHFHSHCLAAHVVASEKSYNEEQDKLPLWQKDATNKFQALCAVCREPISCDVSSLISAPPPLDVEAATGFVLTQELQEMQRQMAELYVYQQSRGGIIDIEAEESKLLLTTEDDPVDERPTPASTSVTTTSNNSATVQPKQQPPQQQHHSQNHNNHNSNSRQNHHGHHHGRNHHRGRGKGHVRRHLERIRQGDQTSR